MCVRVCAPGCEKNPHPVPTTLQPLLVVDSMLWLSHESMKLRVKAAIVAQKNVRHVSAWGREGGREGSK